MGNTLSSNILKDEELVEFQKLNSGPGTDFEIPISSQNRRLTDKKGFLIFAIMMCVFLPFFIYSLVKSDIRRLSHRIDSCGNLCGVANTKIDGISCSGANFTDKPYEKILINDNRRICTSECPFATTQNSTSCVDEDEGHGSFETEEMWLYVSHSWWKFLLVIFITIFLYLGFMLLYRYIPSVVVWSVTVVGLLLSLALPCFFWYRFSKTKNAPLVFVSLLSTIFALVIVVLFITLVKQIKLIIQLYKETTKAIFAVPLTLLVPIIVQLLQCLVLTLFIVSTVWLGTAANLEKINSNTYYYNMSGAMKFAMLMNFIVTIWTLRFFAGCQYMVISGSVAQWYFKKNQSNWAIVVSFTNTIRFHLGTVAVGSFILTVTAVIRCAIKTLLSTCKLRCICDCLCGNIEALLKFLSKNAYIETAIYGQAFFRSGRRAAKLLIENISSVMALNSVGDFVQLMSQFILIAASTAIAFGMFSDYRYAWFPTLVSFFLNWLVVTSLFAVFSTTADTLFICFCEDKSMNDGISKPYFMSKGLMQFVETSKQFYNKNK